MEGSRTIPFTGRQVAGLATGFAFAALVITWTTTVLIDMGMSFYEKHKRKSKKE